MDTVVLYGLLLLQIIIGIGLVYISNYAKKKAENLADKSDLEEMTEVVESVKKKYSDESEILKAHLQVLTSKETEMFSEEKRALIEFYVETNNWIWAKLNLQLADFNHLTVDELGDHIIDIHNTYNKVNVLFSKFCVLTTNQELIKNGRELISTVLKYHQFIEKNMRDLKFSLGLEKGIFQVLSKYIDERKEIPQDGKQFFKEVSEYTSEEKKKLFDSFYDEKLKLFGEVVSKKSEFEGLVKDHLFN